MAHLSKRRCGQHRSSCYGSNKSFRSIAFDVYKKKKTLEKYNRFIRGLLRSRLCVSGEWPCTFFYLLRLFWSTTNNILTPMSKGIAELTDWSATGPVTAGFVIDRQVFLWAGWMKAHSLVHNNMESFSLIWHWTDDPVTVWCSTSKHSMFSAPLHFTSSYSEMWFGDCAAAQHSGFWFFSKLAPGSAVAHYGVIASAPTASAGHRVPRRAATVAPVWRVRVTATATPWTAASSTAIERKQMPGQEAGGPAADGGTGTVVRDRPLSGTVQGKRRQTTTC